MKEKATIPEITPEVFSQVNKRKAFCVKGTKGPDHKEGATLLVWATEGSEARNVARQAGVKVHTCALAFYKFAIAVEQGRFPYVLIMHGPGEGKYLTGRQSVWAMNDPNEHTI
jgi:hypothetical protein